MKEELIAPCGMDCNVCSSYLALKNDVRAKGVRMPYCKGCRPRDKKCSFLKKHCELLMNHKVEFCYECEKFPCEQLKHITKRYETLYRMSVIDNLHDIKEQGLAKFLENQKKKWECPDCGEVICCHNGICFSCGLEKMKTKKKLYRWED
ncbi:DUF3795 domain-containing protein [Candidatus Bathyarchaeota archaeon]|nr:DUF3795 domain-containing protein [Candidatus Bathyarchaeota archaeon]